MTSKLTAKQQKAADALSERDLRFCLLVIDGKRPGPALIEASPAGQFSSASAASISAKRLLNSAKVKTFLSSMREVEVTAAILTKQEYMQLLSQMARGGTEGLTIKPTSPEQKVQIEAGEKLAEMLGWNHELPPPEQASSKAPTKPEEMDHATLMATLRERNLPTGTLTQH